MQSILYASFTRNVTVSKNMFSSILADWMVDWLMINVTFRTGRDVSELCGFSFQGVWRESCVIHLQVRSITVNHTFKIDKARRELGYWPRAYNLVDCVERYQRTRPPGSSRLSVRRPSRPLALLLMTLCLLLLLMLLWRIAWIFWKDGRLFFFFLLNVSICVTD